MSAIIESIRLFGSQSDLWYYGYHSSFLKFCKKSIINISNIYKWKFIYLLIMFPYFNLNC